MFLVSWKMSFDFILAPCMAKQERKRKQNKTGEKKQRKKKGGRKKERKEKQSQHNFQPVLVRHVTHTALDCSRTFCQGTF